jgi:hypothetical protein
MMFVSNKRFCLVGRCVVGSQCMQLALRCAVQIWGLVHVMAANHFLAIPEIQNMIGSSRIFLAQSHYAMYL